MRLRRSERGGLNQPLAQMESPRRSGLMLKCSFSSTEFFLLTAIPLKLFSPLNDSKEFRTEVYLQDHLISAGLPFCYDEHHENWNLHFVSSDFCHSGCGAASGRTKQHN